MKVGSWNFQDIGMSIIMAFFMKLGSGRNVGRNEVCDYFFSNSFRVKLGMSSNPRYLHFFLDR